MQGQCDVLRISQNLKVKNSKLAGEDKKIKHKQRTCLIPLNFINGKINICTSILAYSRHWIAKITHKKDVRSIKDQSGHLRASAAPPPSAECSRRVFERRCVCLAELPESWRVQSHLPPAAGSCNVALQGGRWPGQREIYTSSKSNHLPSFFLAGKKACLTFWWNHLAQNTLCNLIYLQFCLN